MCWMGLVNGQVIGPIWLKGTMDQHMYKAMLEEHVIPLISNIREKWWMQDVATYHTTNMNLEFLKSHFKGTVSPPENF